MFKVVIILGVLAAVFVYEASCQRLILATYRPPPKRPVIYRFRREADEPQWLYKGDDVQRAPATGDHPFLPNYINDIKLDPHTRVARGLSTPIATGSEESHGSSGTRQSSTSITHPGYDHHRNERSIPNRPTWPTLPPFNPRPSGPKSPWEPKPGRFPTLARH